MSENFIHKDATSMENHPTIQVAAVMSSGTVTISIHRGSVPKLANVYLGITPAQASAVFYQTLLYLNWEWSD